MSTLELYTKNAKVWIPHPQEVWESAELLENYSPTKQSLNVLTESGETKSLVIKSEEDLPFLKNPPILLGENDLISLSYLHEPAVLYNLKYRFCQKNYIYTYCGIVLVAINPYTDVPIYDTDTIQAYRGQGIGNLDPHIFGVAEEAYRKLEREQRDQSIIVSGESGAGKTVSAKYTMRYYATVGGSTTETQVEKKVLASSPIMEAIGNAKTTRNDNSSRFGKFIELQFNKQYHISGASMRTYLLEKSRVVFQAPEERNYHIFYQICAARRQFEHLHLDHPNRFHYLNQGESPNVPGVDDLKYFEETVNALNLLGFSESEQLNMFKILAAILHLGNIEIFESLVKVENEMDQEGCHIENTDLSVKLVSELLEIDQTEMIQWLCTRKITSMREVFLKPMTVEDAITSRDALAKHIYSELFNWIVLMINRTLESEEPKYRFVGVLDIYGFETFKINSFEQFCINYANEKLQQQFNLHVFKLEQEEYIVEGIEWKMIDFYDNQLCIDLIEAKLGVLDLLDEECKMPRGSDASWVEKLYSKCIKNPHFSKARFGQSSFVVRHFADKVQYESNGFLEKNRDTILEEQMNVIRGSKNQLVRKLFQSETQKLAPPRTKLKVVSAKPTPTVQKTHKQTVCSQFRESLNKLMTTLNATTPHYVRCIKPNDSKTPFSFQSSLAVQQLRACGVLETIRLSSAGFPSRWTYVDLFYRYRVLCQSTDIDKNNNQKSCQNILTKCIKDSSKYQFGKTKIFFRAGQMAYMEKLRGDKMVECCVLMQKTVRMFICKKKYMRIRKSVGLIQRYGRGLLARRFAQNVRENRAAIKIQKNIRAWLLSKQYQRIRKCILGIQCHIRGYLARMRFQELKYNRAAITIQRYCRGWLARREFKKRIHHIVVCQSAIRRYLARKQYKKLRIEARSIEHVKKLNKGLENKIISLQQRIDELNKTNNEHKHCQTEIQELKTKVQLFRSMETELKACRKDVIAKSERIAKLEEELKTEKEHTIDLIHSHNQFKQEVETERKNMATDFRKLREEVENFNEIDKENIKGAVKEAEEQFKEERLLFIKEIDSNQEQYQKLLNDYHNLEHYVDELKLQLSDGGLRMHKRNISDTSSIAIDIPEDGGYSSVRSAESNREHVENIDWKTDGSSPTTTSTSDSNTNKETEPELNQNIDIGLVLQLQHKLAQSERNNERIRKRFDELNSLPKMEKARSEAENAIRISELELANSQLKSQLCELQNSINEGQGINQLQEQLSLTAKELERRTEEIIQLKSVLANQANSMKSIFSTNLHPDDELAQAYETQKTINKQLELELQDEKTKYLAYEKQLKTEIQKLQDDNEKQQRLLTANLLGSGQTQNEAFLKYEITRLTSENLELRDRMDILNENLKKFKKREGVLVRKLKEAGLELSGGGGESVQVELGAVQPVVTPSRNALVVRKKDREYLGMFSFQNRDVNGVMKQLVHDLKPRTAVALLPGLPAYIIFMCVRYTDYRNDEDLVKTLLSAFNISLKKVIKKRVGDFETTALWLSNTVKLVHNMKQYSGEKQFQTHNTSKQNEQCLRNFDLSEYRQVFTDTAVWIYHGLTRVFTEKIQSLIVPAILEHEEIPGISGNKPSGFRNRLGSSASISSPTGSQKPTQALLQELTNHHKILTYYGVDIELISQIFKQIFYFICASSLNNLLLRKELCHWSKGFQIRHNLSHFEMWTREKNLDETAIQGTLQPIIQAAHLLQARKLEEDVSSICEMCSALTGPQITKLLNLYTPVDEFEQRVSASFIKQVQAKLKERSDAATTGAQTLLMDVKYKYPVRFVFSPSGICLEDIEIPEVINLSTLEKI